MNKIDLSGFHLNKVALEWYNNFPGSTLDAWNSCPIGSWMLWVATKFGVTSRLIVLAKAKSAELVYDLMPDITSRVAVKWAIDYANGIRSLEELNAAAKHALSACMRSERIHKKEFLYSARAAYYASLDCQKGSQQDLAVDSAACATYATMAKYHSVYNVVYSEGMAAEAQAKLSKAQADICRDVMTEEIKSIIPPCAK